MNVTDTIAKINRPIKLDTLQIEVHKLRSTIDSLHGELHDLNIERTYFHDILNSDVAIFVGIITIIVAGIGFLSWKVVTRAVSNAKKEFSTQLKVQKAGLKKFNALFDEKMEVIDKRDAEHTYNISRAMYFGQVGDSDEHDHHDPIQPHHPFRVKLTMIFRAKLTNPVTQQKLWK